MNVSVTFQCRLKIVSLTPDRWTYVCRYKSYLNVDKLYFNYLGIYIYIYIYIYNCICLNVKPLDNALNYFNRERAMDWTAKVRLPQDKRLSPPHPEQFLANSANFRKQ
jgi:hypothetical protein